MMLRQNSGNSSKFSLILFLAVFLFSLGSYYFYQVGAYVFQVLGVFLSFFLFRIKAVRWRSAGFALLFAFFFYILASGAMFAGFTGSENFGAAKLTLPVFVFGYLAFAVVCFAMYPSHFQLVLKLVISIHALVFTFQFIWFLTTGEVLDFLQPVTGEEQRVLGGNYSLSYLPVFARMSGLFNEPGTYSSWMMLLLLLFKLNQKRLEETKSAFWIELWVIVTILLSFSTYGLSFVVIYMFTFIFEKGLTFKTVILLIIGCALFGYFGFEYFDQRFSVGGTDTGVGLRGQAINAYLSILNPYNLTFGLGIFNDVFVRIDNELVAQDVGLWFSIISGTGIVGVLLLTAFFAITLPRNIFGVSLLIVLLLSKFTLTNALVWLILLAFMLLSSSETHAGKKSHSNPKNRDCLQAPKTEASHGLEEF